MNAAETLYIAPASRPAARTLAGEGALNSFTDGDEAADAAVNMDETCPLDGDDEWVVCYRGPATAGGVVTGGDAIAAYLRDNPAPSTKPPVTTWTFSIFDGEGCPAWPTYNGVNLTAEYLGVDEPKDRAVVEQALRDLLEAEAEGLHISDGYAVGQTITAHAWPSDGTQMVVASYTLTAEDLGVDEDECDEADA